MCWLTLAKNTGGMTKTQHTASSGCRFQYSRHFVRLTPEKEPASSRWQKYPAVANGAAGAKAQDLSEIFGTAESRCPDTNLCIGVLAKLEVDLDGAAVSNILRLHA